MLSGCWLGLVSCFIIIIVVVVVVVAFD